jgi:putative ABC transport system permease protein
MRCLRALALRALSAGRRGLWEKELDDELASHLDLHVADNIRAGMEPEEARRDAMLKLGGVEQTKELYRDRRRFPFVDMIVQDGRLALRMMRRSPGLTASALLVLALGIGSNTVMFSVVNAVLLRPLPYPDSDRLQLVQTVDENRSPQPAAPPDYYTLRDRNHSFESLSAFYSRPFDVTGRAEPERIRALMVSSDFFRTLRLAPAIGRDFRPGDERWGDHRVVVLTDAFWRRRYGADPEILGRHIVLNAEPYAVVGILPAGPRASLAWTSQFTFLAADAQAVVPMSFAPGDNRNSHNNYFLAMVGRLGAQATPESTDADLNRVNDEITAAYPENRGTRIESRPLQGALVEDVRRGLLVLFGAVVFVLLIACADLANLLMARAATRRREIAVRIAIGASRRRVLRQLLTESVVLALCGSALALVLAWLSVGTLNSLSQDVLPRNEDVRIDVVVLAYTALMAVGTGILFGFAPAWRSLDIAPSEALQEGARTGGDARGHRLRAALVAAEIAVSLVLLVGAGLMLKSVAHLTSVDAGFDPRGVLTVQVSVPRRKYVDEERERRFSPDAYTKSTRFFADVLERVRALPGVDAAGAINGLPLMGEVWGKSVTLYDRPLPSTMRDLPSIQYRVVAGDYFRALEVPILRGRAFADTDAADGMKVAIVNRAMAQRHWRDRDPIGRILSGPDRMFPPGAVPPNYEPTLFTVVGVVADVHYDSLSTTPVPVVYVPFAQGSEGTTTMYLVARAHTNPRGLAGAIRGRIREVDPDVPASGILTMDDRVSASLARPRLQAAVLGTFALLALFLAAVGTYAVMSYAARQRTREIGIRMAIGASSRAILALLLGRGFAVVGMGLAAGVVGALALTRALRTLLFGVSTSDPAVFLGVTAMLGTIAMVAAWLPARRATRLEPVAALRED